MENGQVVFIEPSWVTGETCLFGIKDKYEYRRIQAKLTKIRKDFIARLESEGFIITYDNNDTKKENVICLIMDQYAVCDKDADEGTFKKAFDKKIIESGGKKLNYPKSMTMEEFFNNPFFPAVLKNELMNGGVDKFLIETKEQLEIIKQFYNDYKDDNKLSEVFAFSIFQQFIETPTNFKTYIRLLMSASGECMGSGLKYSKGVMEQTSQKGIFEKYFCNKDSKYYLNCKGMFNYYSDCGNISFSQPRYSSEKMSILEAHGIDTKAPQIPSELLEVAASIVTKCNRELGIICGIDFIYNKFDNKWYYLENQAFPAIEEWANERGINVVKIKNSDDYVKYMAIEVEARYEALMMYMNKKLSLEDSEKGNQKVLK